MKIGKEKRKMSRMTKLEKEHLEANIRIAHCQLRQEMDPIARRQLTNMVNYYEHKIRLEYREEKRNENTSPTV